MVVLCHVPVPHSGFQMGKLKVKLSLNVLEGTGISSIKAEHSAVDLGLLVLL